MSWQQAYARRGNAFGIKGPFYGPQGHRGQDYIGLGRGASVPAYEHGVVVATGFSSVIGFWISVRLDDGLHAGWAHVIGGSRLPVGTEVWAGTTIAQVGGTDDRPGTAWAGAHIHTTLGPSAVSIHSDTVYDPAPRIQNAITAPAGGGGTPIQEEDIMASIQELDTLIINRLSQWFGAPQYALNVVRREARLRLYRNTATGLMLAADPTVGVQGVVVGPWDPATDPGRADSLRVNYGLTEDLPEQARPLDARQWDNLLHDLGIAE